MKSFKASAVLALCFAIAAPSFASDISSKMAPSMTGTSALSLKPEPEALTVLRDGGVGLGVGTLAGLSFLMITEGTFPASNKPIVTETLTSAMAAGFLGGLVAGVWQIKHDRNEKLKLSVAPNGAQAQLQF